MDKQKAFDEYNLIDMMFESENIDTFKFLWGKDKDAKNGANFCTCANGSKVMKVLVVTKDILKTRL